MDDKKFLQNNLNKLNFLFVEKKIIKHTPNKDVIKKFFVNLF